MTTKTDRYDVAIVGYGPTGATLANLLGLCGVRILILDREADLYHLPRAVHLDDEIMRVFQIVGIAEDLKHKLRVNPGMRFVDSDGALLMDWPRPPEISPQGWHASYRFHQPDLEKLLRQALTDHLSATIRTQAEVISLNDHKNHIDITYCDRATGAHQTVEATYVVGCDGARSTVRQIMSSQMEDLGLHQRWLVVDVLLKHDMPELGDHTVQFCSPDRPMTYCRSPGIRRRWEALVLDHETDEEVSDPTRVWELLSRWITPQDAELERIAVYTFHSSIAKTWRAGRLLIAGDAAHLTPPFMGQGMCAGIRDAVNLAWKLALTVQGRTDPSLLDSYQAERSPHMRQYITTAIRLGAMINALDHDSALAMEGDDTRGRAKMASLAITLGEDDAPLFGAPPSPHRGKLCSQPTLSNGELLDEVTGYQSTLICRTPASFDSVSGGGMAMISADNEPALQSLLDDLEVNAVLVRPDRYILATAKTKEEIDVLAKLNLPSPTASR